MLRVACSPPASRDWQAGGGGRLTQQPANTSHVRDVHHEAHANRCGAFVFESAAVGVAGDAEAVSGNLLPRAASRHLRTLTYHGRPA